VYRLESQVEFTKDRTQIDIS